MKRFLKQNREGQGEILALCNFLILSGKTLPIIPNSEQWPYYCELFCLGQNGIPKDYGLVESTFRISRIDLPNFTSLSQLKRHLIKGVTTGSCFSIHAHLGEGKFHSYLVFDYDNEKGLFSTVNSLIHKTVNPIEYVQWEEITAHMYATNKGQSYYNNKEKTSCYVKDTFLLSKQLELWPDDRIF